MNDVSKKQDSSFCRLFWKFGSFLVQYGKICFHLLLRNFNNAASSSSQVPEEKEGRVRARLMSLVSSEEFVARAGDMAEQ